jgi:cbb3-type cytochrome oxidase maturation protein
MKIIFILIGASLLVALGFLGAFIWAVKTGQYEDDYTPSIRMLFDDNSPKDTSSNIHTTDK